MSNNAEVPNAPQPSIRFFLAREAPVGVLLRRGPSRMVQCLRWDLETDEVTPGQWLKGVVHTERCDLSPDGQLFVYFAANYENRDGSQEYTWTAISRPPFFTALALWFKGPSYNGGGLFETNAKVLLNDLGAHEYSDRFPKPKIAVGSFLAPTQQVEELRMIRDGWKAENPHAVPRVLSKLVGRFEVTETLAYRKSMEVRTCSASIDGNPFAVDGVRQIDVDVPRDRIVYTLGGKLIAFDGTTKKEIADLTDNRFQPLPPAKWTTEWP